MWWQTPGTRLLGPYAYSRCVSDRTGPRLPSAPPPMWLPPIIVLIHKTSDRDMGRFESLICSWSWRS